MASSIRLYNPTSLPDLSQTFSSHVATIEPGCRMVYFAGQVGVDKEGNIPERIEDQLRQAFANLKISLSAAGGKLRNIVNSTLYIVDYDPKDCPIWEVVHECLTDEQGTYYPPGTLVSVPGLIAPQLKIEVQCVAAIPVLSTPLETAPGSSGIKEIDVAVIGAGLSGLKAATDVQSAGFSCVVLEASNRVGGKTLSVPAGPGEGVLDLGAAWINNTTQKRMWALYQKYDCEPLVQRTEGHQLFTGFGLTNVKVANPGLPPVDTEQMRSYESLSASIASDATQINLQDSTANAHINNVSFGHYLRDKGASPSSFAWNMWTTYTRALVGCEPDNIGLLHFLDYIKSGGGLESLLTDGSKGAARHRNRRGNQTICLRMAAELNPGSVYLNTPVTRITQLPEGCLVESAYNNAVFRCRKVILSIPTPLYRHIRFEPPLSAKKQEYVDATHLGTYSKHILVYSAPWWREAGLNGNFCNIDGPMVYSRDVSSDEDSLFALACFTFGEYATRLSKLPSANRFKAIKNQLVTMVGPDLSDKVQDTLQVLEKQWSEEPWLEGAPNPMVAPGDFWQRLGNDLRRPEGDIHFVGTETAFEWKGYMEGAVASGERGAAEVVGSLNGPR